MEEKIRSLYTKMIREENTTEKIDKDMQEEIIGLLQDEVLQMNGESYSKLRDNAFLIASLAEENGFVKGFKYAFWLFVECIWKK